MPLRCINYKQNNPFSFHGYLFTCLLVCRGLRVCAASGKNGTINGGQYDYDLVIIGAGVGGHGAALHAVEQVNRYYYLYAYLFFCI